MPVQRTGTNGPDIINQGTDVNVIVDALGGDDQILLNRTDDLGGGNVVNAGAGGDFVRNLFEGDNLISLGDDDDIYVGSGFALGSSDFDVVHGDGGNDLIAVTTLQSAYFGDAGNDTLVSEGHRNAFDGGSGNDTISYELRDDSSVLGGSGVSVSLADGDQFALTGASTVEELTSIENATGTNAGDILHGSSGANILKGRGGDDQLVGRAGNDTLDGGTGADEMIGGAGNDTYVVDNVGDIVDELNDGGSGTDRVLSSITFSLLQGSRVGGAVENLTLTGTSAINGLGNALNNILIGNSANNGLNGGAGADRLEGGLGNDVYTVDNLSDVVVELAGQGTRDLVRSSVTFNAATTTTVGIENVTLTGTAAINALGNGLNNILIGNSANNGLSGGAGADRMEGGLGNDTYTVDNIGDVVVELAGQGTDLVRSSVTFNAAAATAVGVENITLTGSAAINVLGNGLANTIIGNSAVNGITGGAGADVLTGGGGSDVFKYLSAADSTVAAFDRITDLTNADKIDLSRIDARSNVAGDQAFTLVGAFTGVSGQMTVKFDATGNLTNILMDLNGDGVADMKIVATGNHADFSNFVF